MNRITVLFVLFLLLFGSTMIALAQDPTSEPPVSVVEPPANVVEKPADASVAVPLAIVERLGYWLVIGLLAYLVLSSHKSIRDMISADSARAFYNDARNAASGLTASIPGTLDDALKDIVFNRLNELMEKYWKEKQPPAETPVTEQPRTFIQENAA